MKITSDMVEDAINNNPDFFRHSVTWPTSAFIGKIQNELQYLSDMLDLLEDIKNKLKGPI